MADRQRPFGGHQRIVERRPVRVAYPHRDGERYEQRRHDPGTGAFDLILVVLLTFSIQITSYCLFSGTGSFTVPPGAQKRTMAMLASAMTADPRYGRSMLIT